MKKLISLLLALVLVLGLCACADTGSNAGTTGSAADTTGSSAASGGVIKAGFGRGDITPTESVPLSGYGNTTERMSTGIVSYIYSDAVAIQDENGNVGIIITVDTGSMSEKFTSSCASEIESKTGVPKENIFISANHLHSVPDAAAGTAESGRYATLKQKGVVESGVKAVEDLAPAELYIAEIETQNMVFVRHYEMNDGTFCGDNFGSTASGYKCHESDADPMLRLIKFVREGQTTDAGKEAKNIILAGFQGHPHRNATDANLHYSVFANLPGIFRDTLGKELDCHVAYLTGAGGNLNQHSRIAEENTTKDYKEQGKKLADYALKAEELYTKVSGGEIKVINKSVTYNSNQVGLDRLTDAQYIVDGWLESDDKTLWTNKAIEMGFNSVYHCNAILSRANQDPTKTITIGAMAIGDIAFFYCPFEVFDTTTMAIQKESPFEMTLAMYMTNGASGYMPSALTVSHGGYPVDTTYFEYGTAEKLEAEYIDILKQLAQ